MKGFTKKRRQSHRKELTLCRNVIIGMAVWLFVMWLTWKLLGGIIPSLIPSTNKAAQYAIQVIQGFVFVIATWLITMYVYICLRQINSHTKYAVEVACMSLVILAGVAILLWALYYQTDGTRAFFGSVFTAIGSLTFEGLTDKLANTTIMIDGQKLDFEVLFYGWAIYAGLTFLSIITTKSNYEVFSRIKMVFLLERKKDIYVFSALTEETLTLAESIENENKLNNCTIVFAGPSLKPFDRKDELCIQAMAKGYLYWSYSKGNKKSIDRALYLNNRNSKKYKKRFVVFAFATDNDVPSEEDNMEFVFSDIKKRIRRKKQFFGIDNKLRIEYYILTKRTINYPAYDLTDREFICEYFDAINPKQILVHEDGKSIPKQIRKMDLKGLENDFKKYVISSKDEQKAKEKEIAKRLDDKQKAEEKETKEHSRTEQIDNEDLTKKRLYESELYVQTHYSDILKAIREDYADRIIINVWSEALTIAKDAAWKSTDLIVSKIKSWEGVGCDNQQQNLTEERNTIGDRGAVLTFPSNKLESLNIWCLGFGSTAQEIAKAVYAQSSYIDLEGKSPEVHIFAYDKNMDTIEGLFKMEHPCSIVIKEDKNASYNQSNNNPNREGSDIDIEPQKSSENDEFKIKGPSQELTYPVFHFKKWDCCSREFLEEFDKMVVGASAESKIAQQEQPDVFVIATGDDYNNIRIANAIIQDTVNESISAVDIKGVNNDAVEGDSHGSNKHASNKKQIIFVNVWDKKNNELLLTCGGEKRKSAPRREGDDSAQPSDAKWDYISINDKLDVYVVGNNEDVYSYEVINTEEESRYHANYKAISGFIYSLINNRLEDKLKEFCKEKVDDNDVIDVTLKKAKELLENLKKCIFRGEEISKEENNIRQMFADIKDKLIGNEAKAKEYINSISSLKSLKDITMDDQLIIALMIVAVICDEIQVMEEENRLKEYGRVDVWAKESNQLAELYYKVLANVSSTLEEKGMGINKYHRLCKMEHLRWCRVHWSNGWTYTENENKSELKRQHNCLCGFAYIEGHYLYDVINVLFAETRKYGK